MARLQAKKQDFNVLIEKGMAAFSEIARFCGLEEWDEPGEVVEAVRGALQRRKDEYFRGRAKLAAFRGDGCYERATSWLQEGSPGGVALVEPNWKGRFISWVIGDNQAVLKHFMEGVLGRGVELELWEAGGVYAVEVYGREIPKVRESFKEVR